jgi:hypothetical protein
MREKSAAKELLSKLRKSPKAVDTNGRNGVVAVNSRIGIPAASLKNVVNPEFANDAISDPL